MFSKWKWNENHAIHSSPHSETVFGKWVSVVKYLKQRDIFLFSSSTSTFLSLLLFPLFSSLFKFHLQPAHSSPCSPHCLQDVGYCKRSSEGLASAGLCAHTAELVVVTAGRCYQPCPIYLFLFCFDNLFFYYFYFFLLLLQFQDCQGLHEIPIFPGVLCKMYSEMKLPLETFKKPLKTLETLFLCNLLYNLCLVPWGCELAASGPANT